MIRSILIFVGLVTIAWGIQCYVGQQTYPGVASPLQIMNCPTSDFCFQSYVKRHHNGDDSFTQTKDCGQPGKCFQEGCEGPGDQKRCCCVGDLCNSSNGLTLTVAGIIAIIFQTL